jgi:hypothetical protein
MKKLLVYIIMAWLVINPIISQNEDTHLVPFNSLLNSDTSKTIAQKEDLKINITGGFGFGEMLNAGLRFQEKQVQVGISVGTFPQANFKSFAISGDVYYHFGGTSKYSMRRPWYARLGYIYSKEEDDFNVFNYKILNFRVGRDINFSRRFGLDIDGGFLYFLSHDKVEKIKRNSWLKFGFFEDIKFLPSFGLNFFYRI